MKRTFLLTLFLLASPAFGGEAYVGPAWLEPEGELCFQLPDGMVDWGALAKEALGPALDRPDPDILRQTYFESGGVSRVRFEAPVPPQVATRGWQLLHEDGMSALQPGRLRGEVRYKVDRKHQLLDQGPSNFYGSACASSPPARPAFVVDGAAVEWTTEAVPWTTETAGSFSFQTAGERYLFEPPRFAKAEVRKVLVLRSGERQSRALVSWAPDLRCEKACCEYAFSLFELAPGGKLRMTQQNGYRCDV
jgi:hypothetical protein